LSSNIQPVKNILFLTGFFILVVLMGGCEPAAPKAIALTGYTMGTSYHIKVVGDDLPSSDSLQKEVDELLVGVNNVFSTYLESSEVSQLNAYNGMEWREMSEEFVSLTEMALELSRITEGAYDVTVGPLVNLWGFGPSFTEGDIPDDADIQRALAKIGYESVVLDIAANKLKKLTPDIYIDFSSIAKGYGVDQVAELIVSKGYLNYMVEIGGEMRVSGINGEGVRWRIAVEKPDSSTRAIQRVIQLSNTAIATSGDYRNFFTKDGQRFSHTLDPVTGSPVQHSLASVTVLSPSSALADGWATAFMVLGAKKGHALAIENELAVLFLVKNGANIEEIMTPHFKELIAEDSL